MLKYFALSNFACIFVLICAILTDTMNLIVSKSKNSATYYVQKSFRGENKKTTTKIIERLGSMEELCARFGDDDPIGEARKYVAELTAAEKESRRKVVVEYSPSLLIKKGEQRSYNVGYLFLQKVYYELGLDKICKKIEKRYKNEYDLNSILSMLLYTRILYPGSKLSSLEDAKKFTEQPTADIHQVYRALSLLSKESDNIQAAVYKNSLKLGKRNDKVLYYDCTNYYFETEEESGLRQYGYSKEHRPNPIVQMGLFTDMDGFPLAFCINPGNTAETVTLKPLEEKLKENFNLSKVVVCTDGGLSSYKNRKSDSLGGRSFITVQSLKKLEKHLQDWALERDDIIKAHFLTCFLSLLIYKYLAKKINVGGSHFTPDEIISTLQQMNMISVAGEGYIPAYTRSNVTNNLHGSAGFRTDTQIVVKQRMKEIIGYTKKSKKRIDNAILAQSSKNNQGHQSPLQRYVALFFIFFYLHKCQRLEDSLVCDVRYAFPFEYGKVVL